jgi:hypothetical protein
MRKIILAVGALLAASVASGISSATPVASLDLLASPAAETDGSGYAFWTGSFNDLAGSYNIAVSLNQALASATWIATLDLSPTSGAGGVINWTGPGSDILPNVSLTNGQSYNYTFQLYSSSLAPNPVPAGTVSAQLTAAVPGPIAGSGLGGLLAAALASALVFARRSGSLRV